MRERPDFAQVRLSAAGIAFAGRDATLRIVTGRMHYLFQGDTPVEVLRAAELPMLSTECDAAGKPLFEEVPATADTPIPASAA